ncbi:MAG: hypothetical protein HY303_02495 [Candidatus Wallbacteria bacterium]|nr:hypothetical protein [Candidatus Wallbacteria bacterium]
MGGLFNSDTDTTVTVDLLIFVTPQIVPELAAAATEPATAVVLEPAPRAPAKPVRTTLAVPVPRERTVKASAPLGTELVGGRVPRSLSSTDKPGPSRSEEPARSEAAAPSWLSASAEPSVATTTPDAPRAQSWRRRFARVPRKPHASAPDPD